MARIKDIAAKAQISTAAVSIYLKDTSTTRVSTKSKKRIDEAIEELSYRPNAMARALSNAKSQTIGVLIPYEGPLFRSSFVNEILSGLQQTLFQYGYTISFPPASGVRSSVVLKNQLDRSGGFDGYVIFGTRYCTTEDIQENARLLERAGMPFVMVNVPELNQHINQIVLRESIQSDPMEYLISLDHKRILVMVGRDYSPDSIECIEACKNIFEKNGLEYRTENILYGDYEMPVARSAMLQRLRQGLDFSAVYCLSDTMAMGVYEAFFEYGIAVPQQVSVIGRNDSFFARLLSPPLTTVKRPMYEAGAKAAEVLLRSIETERSGIKIYLDGNLIVRGSTQVYQNNHGNNGI